MYSFGAPHATYKKVYNESKPFVEPENPGPGHYKIPTKLGEAKKFSLISRIPADSHIRVSSKTPGPGSYELKNA